jgi:hypothetical protein
MGTLVKICKALYERYELYYEKRAMAVLFKLCYKSSHVESIKAFRLHHGWLHLKLALILGHN